MKYLAASLFVFMVGCSDPPVERRCLPDETRQTERAEFVIRCATAANPMSDDEAGDDLVRACKHVANDIFCVRTWAVRGQYFWTPCQHANVEQQSACRRAGW